MLIPHLLLESSEHKTGSVGLYAMIYFAHISDILGTSKNNFEPMFSSIWAMKSSQMSHRSVPSLSSLLFPGDENMFFL